VSAPNPGDVLPLWNPEIPGEEIQAGRLGIRIRPGSPAAEKVKALEAFGGAERLREMLEELKQIDGTYQVTKPEKPLEFIGQVSTTLLTGKLGRTPMGLALELTDWQDLDGEYEMEKNRLRLRYQELQLVKEWDGDLEGFTAIVLREKAKTEPILGSTLRFIEHLRDFREKLAEAAVRKYEATEQWIECPNCETEVPTSNGIHCPECNHDMRGGEYVRAVLHLVDEADGRIYRGIDSLTVRSAGFPEYRGMSLERIQGSNLWVSFRRYDPLPDEGIVLPTASVEMFEAQRSVIRQLQIGRSRDRPAQARRPPSSSRSAASSAATRAPRSSCRRTPTTLSTQGRSGCWASRTCARRASPSPARCRAASGRRSSRETTSSRTTWWPALATAWPSTRDCDSRCSTG